MQENTVWYPYEKGKTIGKPGPNNGKIIEDLEHIQGARVTTEVEQGEYFVTIAVESRLLFHSHYAETEENARQFAADSKMRIEKLYEMLDVPKAQQDDAWLDAYDLLTNEITEFQ